MLEAAPLISPSSPSNDVRAVPKIEFFSDLRSFWKELRRNGDHQAAQKLMEPNAWKALQSYGWDWTAILLSIGAVFLLSPWFLPLAVLVVGTRQRALSNLTHDGSHGNLFPDRRWNNRLTNVLSSFAMNETVEGYQRSHELHHTHLGSLTLEPDARTHLSYGYNDLDPRTDGFWRNALRLVVHPQAWRESVFGPFLKLSPREKLVVLGWWATLLGTLAGIGGWSLAGAFLGIWYLARATSYHCVRLFAEFGDHTGLSPTSLVDFSRTFPHRGLLTHIFHPHCDTYHLVHHLAPGIPHYRLGKAHALFERHEIYRSGHHCDGYFRGNHSAAACWMGECQAR